MKFTKDAKGRIVRAESKPKDMGDVAVEARAEQSRRVGLPPPGAVDRAMKAGGRALVEGGAKLAKAGMLGPVAKAPIVKDAADAVTGVVKRGVQAFNDMREENRRRGPRNPKWMAEAADATVGNMARTAEILPAQVGVGSPYKYKHSPPKASGPTGGARTDNTRTKR